jgi:N-carbamoylputrescine amidase
MPRTADTIRLGLIQHASPPDADLERTFDKAIAMIRDAAGQGAQVVATQELFLSHYFPQVEDEKFFALAEPIPGPRSQRLCELARKLGIELTASLFEKRAPGVYHNTSIMIDTQGEIVGKYRKMHIPDDPRFYEKYYFTPGDADTIGWQVQRLRSVTTGMLICWDQWFPEAARLTALKGAQILFYPTAIGWYHGETPEDARQQKEAWTTVQRAHAISNGVFVAAINRIGVEGDLKFWGSSFVADPGGTIIAQAGEDQEQVLIADCDLSRIDQIRHGWPFLRDRRVDAYGPIVKRLWE